MKNIILLITTIIAVFSLIHLRIEITSFRWLRLITSGIFFFFALGIGSYKKPLGITAFGILMICDFFLLFWEAELSKYGYYLSHILSIIILLFLTIRVLEKIKISLFDILILCGFLIINLWILILLGQFFSLEVNDRILEVLFYINGFSIILLVLAAFFFSANNANIITSYFFLGVMCIAISELTLFAIFFMRDQDWRYIDNLFYVFGLFFLLRSYHEHIMLEKLTVTEDDKKVAETTYNRQTGFEKLL